MSKVVFFLNECCQQLSLGYLPHAFFTVQQLTFENTYLYSLCFMKQPPIKSLWQDPLGTVMRRSLIIPLPGFNKTQKWAQLCCSECEAHSALGRSFYIASQCFATRGEEDEFSLPPPVIISPPPTALQCERGGSPSPGIHSAIAGVETNGKKQMDPQSRPCVNTNVAFILFFIVSKIISSSDVFGGFKNYAPWFSKYHSFKSTKKDYYM